MDKKVNKNRIKRRNGDILVPLIDGVIMHKDRFKLYSSEKALVLAGTIVDGESYLRRVGSDITKKRVDQETSKNPKKCEKEY